MSTRKKTQTKYIHEIIERNKTFDLMFSQQTNCTCKTIFFLYLVFLFLSP